MSLRMLSKDVDKCLAFIGAAHSDHGIEAAVAAATDDDVAASCLLFPAVCGVLAALWVKA